MTQGHEGSSWHKLGQRHGSSSLSRLFAVLSITGKNEQQIIIRMVTDFDWKKKDDWNSSFLRPGE